MDRGQRGPDQGYGSSTGGGRPIGSPDFSGCDSSSQPTDFNDLHVLSGNEAVNQAIAAAKKVGDATQPVSDPPLLPDRKPSEGPESGRNVAGADGDFHSLSNRMSKLQPTLRHWRQERQQRRLGRPRR